MVPGAADGALDESDVLGGRICRGPEGEDGACAAQQVLHHDQVPLEPLLAHLRVLAAGEPRETSKERILSDSNQELPSDFF